MRLDSVIEADKRLQVTASKGHVVCSRPAVPPSIRAATANRQSGPPQRQRYGGQSGEGRRTDRLVESTFGHMGEDNAGCRVSPGRWPGHRVSPSGLASVIRGRSWASSPLTSIGSVNSVAPQPDGSTDLPAWPRSATGGQDGRNAAAGPLWPLILEDH